MASVSNQNGCPIPAERVEGQLRAILSSPAFANSPRLSRFLEFAVAATLAGNAANLKEYQLGLDVFGRPESFNPKTDPVVRVEARQLRFKLAEYYLGAGSNDPFVISIPKGAYAARFEAREEVKPAEAVPDPDPVPVPPPPRPSPVRWAAVLVALCAIGAGIGWRSPSPRAQAQGPSLVVLPFVNTTGDPANDYLAYGLTDGVTGALARVKSLRVIAASSAAQFKSSSTGPRQGDADLKEVGHALNVANAVTGSIARNGGGVRIVARLGRTPDASVAWTRTWDGTLSNLYAIQTEIAAAITGTLHAASPFRPVTPNAEAQDLFLRARYAADQLTRSSLEHAVADYERAVELDPGYAAAWYGLAVARHRLPYYAADWQLFDRSKVESAYRKAIELDPGFAEPHTGLALLAMVQDQDWGRAERELEAADAIAPTAIAESHAALVSLYCHRDVRRVEEHIRRARDLDPLGSAVLLNTVQVQVMVGQYEAARQVAERFAAQHPDVVSAQEWIAYSYLAEGRAEVALDRFRALRGKVRGVEMYEAIALARLGRGAEARALMDAQIRRPGQPDVQAYRVAAVYGYLRDETRALEWLDHAATYRNGFTVYAALDPAFQSMRSSPAFQALLKRIGYNPE